MQNQNQIFEKIKSVIPATLWSKYTHLSFAEMAEIPELQEWADDLIQAESDWFENE